MTAWRPATECDHATRSFYCGVIPWGIPLTVSGRRPRIGRVRFGRPQTQGGNSASRPGVSEIAIESRQLGRYDGCTSGYGWVWRYNVGSQSSVPSEAVDNLFKALSVLSRTVDRVLHDRAVKEALGESVSHSKVQVLRLLSYRGGQTSGQIARFLGITRPSVTQSTDVLERAGWITRRTSTQDGRESIHELSEMGRQKFNLIRRQQRHLLRNTLRMASQPEARAWTDAMQAIATALARSDRAFEQFCLQCGAHADGTCVLVGGDVDCPFLNQRDPGRRPLAGKSTRRRPH